MCGLTIDHCTETETNNMAIKGPGTQGTWKSTELSAKNRKMKYDTCNEFFTRHAHTIMLISRVFFDGF